MVEADRERFCYGAVIIESMGGVQGGREPFLKILLTKYLAGTTDKR